MHFYFSHSDKEFIYTRTSKAWIDIIWYLRIIRKKFLLLINYNVYFTYSFILLLAVYLLLFIYTWRVINKQDIYRVSNLFGLSGCIWLGHKTGKTVKRCLSTIPLAVSVIDNGPEVNNFLKTILVLFSCSMVSKESYQR